MKLFVSRFCMDRRHKITSERTFLREHDVRTCLPFGNCCLTHELLFSFNSNERVSYNAVRVVIGKVVASRRRCSAQNFELRELHDCILRYRMIFGFVSMCVYMRDF